MKISDIDIQATVAKARVLLHEDKQMSSSTKSIIEILIVIISLLANRLDLNSRNSSQPPSSDPNRPKKSRAKSARKPGGQNGHVGTTLKKVDNPDRVETIRVNHRKLPKGQYRHVGYQTRQVFDIDISRVVTEYQAEVVAGEKGHRIVAPFPEGVTQAAQYGEGVKTHAVYLSQFQLLPYNRIQDYFADQLEISISEDTIFNFNQEAFERLSEFELKARDELAACEVAHADETGINIGGKRYWLHGFYNEHWTH